MGVTLSDGTKLTDAGKKAGSGLVKVDGNIPLLFAPGEDKKFVTNATGKTIHGPVPIQAGASSDIRLRDFTTAPLGGGYTMALRTPKRGVKIEDLAAAVGSIVATPLLTSVIGPALAGVGVGAKTATIAGAAAAQGLVGGATSAMRGGDFGQGFVRGAVTGGVGAGVNPLAGRVASAGVDVAQGRSLKQVGTGLAADIVAGQAALALPEGLDNLHAIQQLVQTGVGATTRMALGQSGGDAIYESAMSALNGPVSLASALKLTPITPSAATQAAVDKTPAGRQALFAEEARLNGTPGPAEQAAATGAVGTPGVPGDQASATGVSDFLQVNDPAPENTVRFADAATMDTWIKAQPQTANLSRLTLQYPGPNGGWLSVKANTSSLAGAPVAPPGRGWAERNAAWIAGGTSVLSTLGAGALSLYGQNQANKIEDQAAKEANDMMTNAALASQLGIGGRSGGGGGGGGGGLTAGRVWL
jgi:hypothetical protein